MKERSYLKKSYKTKPTGVRIDVEQLEYLLKKHPNLETKQRAVDFLFNKFWWDNHIHTSSYKGLPPAEQVEDSVKEKSVTNQRGDEKAATGSYFEAPESPKAKTQYDFYLEDIKGAKTVSECASIGSTAKADGQLTYSERKQIESLAIERSKEIDY